MDIIEKLRAGDVKGFNAARDDQDRVDLFASELDGVTAVGADLSGAMLDKSDLTGADLSEATLHGASLDEVDGGELVLARSKGLRVRLRGAWLEQADLSEVEFTQSDLSGATLTDARLDGARLLSTRFHDIDAEGSSWVGADLTEATLKGARLARADFSRARLVEARCGGVKLPEATLDGAVVETARLDGASLVGASLVGARLVGSSLVEADLSGARLAHADLSGCDLSRAKLSGADLSGAVLSEACLEGADLSGAVLAGADLTGSDPSSLGLSAEQVAGLASWGARFDPDAAVVFERASVGAVGDAVGLVWRNPDAVDAPTLRWALRCADDSVAAGVLPVSATSVHAHEIAAVPDGFRLLLLVERADGFVIQSWPLDREGRLGAVGTLKLTADPLSPPVWQVRDGVLWGWLLTRDGPTLRVLRDRLDGSGLVEVRREKRPQVLGLTQGSAPVLLGKGGVGMGLTFEGAGPPRRLPDGFPADVGGAIASEDGLVGVVFTPPALRREGGLFVQRVGPRGADEAERVLAADEVSTVDVVPGEGDEVRIAWVATRGGKQRVGWVTWPGGEPTEVAAGSAGLAGVRWLADPASGAARLLVAGRDGRLAVVDAEGSLVGHLDAKEVRSASRAAAPPRLG